jgi:nicotinamide-nucleotide amidase
MVSSAITDVAGSSAWFERAFVTYSNQAKHEMLGVPLAVLKNFGAVSEQTVKEMSIRALKKSKAQISVAISGIAGPGGATLNKKVGTVCFAFASKNKATVIESKHFEGNRLDVRQQSTIFALQGLINAAQ